VKGEKGKDLVDQFRLASRERRRRGKGGGKKGEGVSKSLWAARSLHHRVEGERRRQEKMLALVLLMPISPMAKEKKGKKGNHQLHLIMLLVIGLGLLGFEGGGERGGKKKKSLSRLP